MAETVSPFATSETPELTPSHLPEFDGGSFAIHYLSTSPEGFQVVTDETVPKTGELALNSDEKQALGTAMKREMQFNKVDEVRDARQAWSEDRSNPQLEADFYNARAKYQNKGKKIGLRNIKVEGDTIHTDVQTVHFPAYNLFGQPNQGSEKERISRIAGTAMVVRTADDRLLIQHRAIEKQRLGEAKRSRGNASYTDIPGASVAGIMDASLRSAERTPGMPDAIDTDSVRRNILKEAGEELGLGAEHFTKVRIAGVAEDHIKVHDELLLLADTNMTAADVKETSRLSTRNKNLGDADFEEKFVDIPATPEAIALLLTEVHCPLPPTHAATLVAAGFSLAIQTRGAEFAEQWREQVETGVRSNYQHMDSLVSAYYQRFPEALQQVPERFWGKPIPTRNPHGYDPAYGPEEQGLPSFEDEMVRAGLLEETRETVPAAYLFDVDGPLSDPHERRVVEEDLFTEIIDRLQAGEPVGLNSGRSVAWIENQVVSHIVERIEDKSLLERFIVIGEKGGAWLTFDANGQPAYGNVAGITVPPELANGVHSLVAEQFADCVADLDPKQTMLSLEMLPGYDLATFSNKKQALAEELQKVLSQQGLEGNYRVDATTIAVDIESPFVGKDVGADRFLQHLSDLGIKPQHFEAFGDSPSDAAMADELNRRGHSVHFVYVGKPEEFDRSTDYPVTVVGDYSQGSLRYLSQQANQIAV